MDKNVVIGRKPLEEERGVDEVDVGLNVSKGAGAEVQGGSVRQVALTATAGVIEDETTVKKRSSPLKSLLRFLKSEKLK